MKQRSTSQAGFAHSTGERVDVPFLAMDRAVGGNLETDHMYVVVHDVTDLRLEQRGTRPRLVRVALQAIAIDYEHSHRPTSEFQAL